jgi:hypothetical protein
MAERDSELLQLIRLHPWFWLSAHHAMLVATFVALGRIFDSPHNINALVKAVETDLGEFSADALKARLIEKGRSPEEATQHVTRVLEQVSEKPEAPIPLAAAGIDKNLADRAHAQVRELRKKVARWRRVYQSYDDIRNKIFAHKELSSSEEIDALFAKTSADELKKLFKFLSSLRLALFAAYANGDPVDLDRFDPDMFVGERVRREGEKILKLIVEGGRVLDDRRSTIFPACLSRPAFASAAAATFPTLPKAQAPQALPQAGPG